MPPVTSRGCLLQALPRTREGFSSPLKRYTDGPTFHNEYRRPSTHGAPSANCPVTTPPCPSSYKAGEEAPALGGEKSWFKSHPIKLGRKLLPWGGEELVQVAPYKAGEEAPALGGGEGRGKALVRIGYLSGAPSKGCAVACNGLLSLEKAFLLPLQPLAAFESGFMNAAPGRGPAYLSESPHWAPSVYHTGASL